MKLPKPKILDLRDKGEYYDYIYNQEKEHYEDPDVLEEELEEIQEEEE